jgi:hypothetical protein
MVVKKHPLSDIALGKQAIRSPYAKEWTSVCAE